MAGNHCNYCTSCVLLMADTEKLGTELSRGVEMITNYKILRTYLLGVVLTWKNSNYTEPTGDAKLRVYFRAK